MLTTGADTELALGCTNNGLPVVDMASSFGFIIRFKLIPESSIFFTVFETVYFLIVVNTSKLTLFAGVCKILKIYC